MRINISKRIISKMLLWIFLRSLEGMSPYIKKNNRVNLYGRNNILSDPCSSSRKRFSRLKAIKKKNMTYNQYLFVQDAKLCDNRTRKLASKINFCGNVQESIHLSHKNSIFRHKCTLCAGNDYIKTLPSLHLYELITVSGKF